MHTKEPNKQQAQRGTTAENETVIRKQTTGAAKKKKNI